MLRLALALAVLPAAACTMSADSRPKTLPYITETILAPYCGAAQCHSSFTAAYDDVFDTVEGARRSIVRNKLVQMGGAGLNDDRQDPHNALLVAVVELPFGLHKEIGRMPYDAPLPDADIDLLARWVGNGSAAGGAGAQCDPDAPEHVACNNDTVWDCSPDGDFMTQFIDCTSFGSHCIPPDFKTGAAAHCCTPTMTGGCL